MTSAGNFTLWLEVGLEDLLRQLLEQGRSPAEITELVDELLDSLNEDD